MRISQKVKTIVQNRAQHNLGRQTAKISSLSSVNVNRYEFLTDRDVLLEKELLEEAAAIKRFEYFPLGKELKKQTSVTENQYLIEFDKQYLIK